MSALYYRPRLNRVLESEEERLGSEADDSAFHANLLQLLGDHKKELATPVSRVTERVLWPFSALSWTSVLRPAKVRNPPNREPCALYADSYSMRAKGG